MLLTNQDVCFVMVATSLLICHSNNGFHMKALFSVLVGAELSCVLMVDAHVVVGVLRKLRRLSPKLVGCIVLVMGVSHSFVLTVVGHVAQLVFVRV